MNAMKLNAQYKEKESDIEEYDSKVVSILHSVERKCCVYYSVFVGCYFIVFLYWRKLIESSYLENKPKQHQQQNSDDNNENEEKICSTAPHIYFTFTPNTSLSTPLTLFKMFIS